MYLRGENRDPPPPPLDVRIAKEWTIVFLNRYRLEAPSYEVTWDPCWFGEGRHGGLCCLYHVAFISGFSVTGPVVAISSQGKGEWRPSSPL